MGFVSFHRERKAPHLGDIRHDGRGMGTKNGGTGFEDKGAGEHVLPSIGGDVLLEVSFPLLLLLLLLLETS